MKYAAILTILGGRKFVFASVAGIVITALFATSMLSEAGFIDLFQWTSTGYLGANAFARVAASRRD